MTYFAEESTKILLQFHENETAEEKQAIMNNANIHFSNR